MTNYIKNNIFSYVNLKINVFFILCIFLNINLIHAQCSISAGADQSVCVGNPVTLNAVAAGSTTYQWSAGQTTQSISVNPSVTTTYIVSTTCYTGELIVNGDFEQGNTGFSSQYVYDNSPPLNEACYYIGNNGNSLSNGWSACQDHTTGSPGGHIMLVNGATAANTSLWCQTINVVPNTVYQFSAWATPLYPSNPPVLQFSINGILLGSPFSVTNNLCLWQQFYQVWNSGSNTTATICVVNQNTQGGGNDFALDDISFISVVDVSDTVVVNVYNNLNISVTPASSDICAGNSVQLTAGGASNFSWSPASGLSSASGATVIATPAATTVYTVTGTDNTTCTGSTDVVINVNPLPVVTATPSVAGICMGDSALLGASGAANYIWSPSAGLSATTGSLVYAKPIVNTVYAVTGTDANACTDSAYVTVNVNPLPALTVSPSLSKICSGGNVQITAGGASVYTWSPPAGLSSTSGNIVIASPAANITYTVYGTDLYGCKSTDTATVEVSNLYGNISSTDEICGKSDGSVDVDISNSAGICYYLWNNGQTTSSINNLDEGVYICTVTDGICTLVLTENVNGIDGPDADFVTSPYGLSVAGSLVTFIDQSTGNISSWVWTTGDDLPVLPGNITSHVFDNPGDYMISLVVTDINGCIDSVTKVIHVEDFCAFYVPDAFTPNDDGINDRFTPYGLCVDPETFEMLIFNRWGNLVYRTTKWDGTCAEAWDGTCNNMYKAEDNAIMDVYVYVISFKDLNGITKKYIGKVSLVL